MKLIDFDGLFDEKLAQFMEENKNKYTEKQWEDIIPRLYKKFGDTYVAKVKCTPKQYYTNATDSELVEMLSAHLREDVPVPEFLCAEIETRGEKTLLLPLLFGDEEILAIYAFNLLGDEPQAYEAYFSVLTENKFSEDMRSDITEIFKLHADEWKDRAFETYQKGVAKEYMLEILSRVTVREERIYETLMRAFLSGENTPMHASFLASYGDERALPVLLKHIENPLIGFVEFQELKYAIEALGGEYDEPRDFSGDKDYLAVEAQTAKLASQNREPRA